MNNLSLRIKKNHNRKQKQDKLSSSQGEICLYKRTCKNSIYLLKSLLGADSVDI